MDFGHSMRMLLRYLLAHPGDTHLMNQVVEAAGVPRGTIGQLVHRLASIGWVEWIDSDGQTKPFKLTADGITGARESLQRAVTAPAASRVRVWTMRELRAAVAAGEQPEGILIAAEAAMRESRREARHRRE